MTPQQERRYLESVLKLFDSGAPWLLCSRWGVFGFWLLAVAIMVVVLQIEGKAPSVVTNSACLFLGVVLGTGFIWRTAAMQWPFLRRHVSRDSVVRRINELGP